LYETLSQFKSVVYIDSIPAHTVSLEGLLLTKQAVREKDIMDRKILEMAIARHKYEEAQSDVPGMR
jgi:hypothetical protein